MEYKDKYLKYKSKYLKLKGGRLIDILDVPGNSRIKKDCGNLEQITQNFSLCNKINDKLATSENSYVIFLWFLSSVDINSLKTLENIILNHKAPSSNIKIYSHNNFTTPNSLIQSIQLTNSNAVQIIQNDINNIITNHKNEHDKLNITIYNLAHGALQKFNTPQFINSDNPKIFISKEQYFDMINPVFNSSNFVNLTLVNNNCYSTYITHGYFKNKISSLLKQNPKVNLFTYSLRPFIKYLLYLRFILLFFTKDFIDSFKSKTTNCLKFALFSVLNSKIQNKLDTDPIFLREVKNIFYKEVDEIKTDLTKLFDLFVPENGNFNYLNNIVLKLDNSKYVQSTFSNVSINNVDLYDDENITNSILGFLEQSSFLSTKSFLQLKIRNEESAEVGMTLYDLTFDINNSIQEINNSVKTGNSLIEFMVNDWLMFAGNVNLKEFLDDNLITTLIRMSFDEQKDILFIPVEPNDDKRELMRQTKLIDLL